MRLVAVLSNSPDHFPIIKAVLGPTFTIGLGSDGKIHLEAVLAGYEELEAEADERTIAKRLGSDRDEFIGYLEAIEGVLHSLQATFYTVTKVDRWYGKGETGRIWEVAKPPPVFVGSGAFLAGSLENSARIQSRIIYDMIGHEPIRRAFGLLRRQPTWAVLYHVFEIVQGERGSKMYRNSRVKKRGERFSHTANSPEVLGTDSRHGKQSHQSPDKPMPYHEADNFVRDLVLQWVKDVRS